MANFVNTNVKINGKKGDIKKIMENITNKDEYDDLFVDLDKIVPMPDEIQRGNLKLEDRKKDKLNWYDGSIENWGTKWNTINNNFYYIEELEDPDILDNEKITINFEFKTARSFPYAAFKKFQSKLKDIVSEDVEIIMEFADEDLGYNYGKIKITPKKLEENYQFAGEKTEEALKFACEVWGYDYDEYKKEMEEFE